jgi:nucleoid DNA-binding protein
MAKKITAIRTYRPEFKHKSTLQMAQVVEYIARRTGLNTGEILLNVYELRDTIVDAHRNGQAVKIEGLGTFTPTLRMDGSVDVLFRPDVQMLRELNSEELYATIINKNNIGKSTEELVAKWNAEHPQDPVEE